MRFKNCDLLYFSISKLHHKISTNTIFPKSYYHLIHQATRCERSNPLKNTNADELFDEMPDQNVVSITAAMGRSARVQRHEDALRLFTKMLKLDITPSEFTFGTVIPSSTALGDMNIGKQLHCFAMKLGVQGNVFVGSALLDMYAKLGSVEEAFGAFEDIHEPNVVSWTALLCGYMKNERFDEAREIFEGIPERNVVTWNAMIGGFSQTGENEEAVNLFVQMLKDGVLPDHDTFPCVIIAAANIAALGIGRSLHASAVKYLGKISSSVGNSLITFYAKCGSVEDSLLIFDKLTDRTVVSWNALACGYAQYGSPDKAMELFKKMKENGFQPNRVTILVLLWAYNHAGWVQEGLGYFNMVKLKYQNIIDSAHYACMVDLLSRSGRFSEAERFLSELPFDLGVGFWKALLGGCQIHSNTELGEYAARRILALDPQDVPSYVMISNAHSLAGRWENMSMVRRWMREKGMKRVPGFSWIEIGSQIHKFVTLDQNHRDKEDIYMILEVFFEHCTYQTRKF
ncbi:hypothetical protein Droror1_Dr00026115 [Drosera rotundifolia]